MLFRAMGEKVTDGERAGLDYDCLLHSRTTGTEGKYVTNYCACSKVIQKTFIRLGFTKCLRLPVVYCLEKWLVIDCCSIR
jgi:hypothetical protein